MSATTHIEPSAGYPWSQTITRAHSFIETSREIHEFTKMHITNLAKSILWQTANQQASLRNQNYNTTPLAHRKHINDPRASPAITIVEELANRGAAVRPYIPFALFPRRRLGSMPRPRVLRWCFPGRSVWFLTWNTVCGGISVEMVRGGGVGSPRLWLLDELF